MVSVPKKGRVIVFGHLGTLFKRLDKLEIHLLFFMIFEESVVWAYLDILYLMHNG